VASVVRPIIPQYAEDGARPWYPTATVLRDLEPTRHFNLLRDIALPWYWKLDSTTQWLVAHTLYLPNWQLFGGTIHIQIVGPSGSGKSALAEGWYTGRTKESVCMTPGCVYLTNASAAAIYQTYANCTTPLVFDEVLDHESKRTRELLELVRDMESGGSSVRRGTKDGSKQILYPLMTPTVWASIRVPSLGQDLNRRFLFELHRKDPPPDNPWKVIRAKYPEAALQALAASNCELLIRHRKRLVDIHQSVVHSLATVGGSAYRMAVRATPLLAIMELCGQDIAPMIDDMIARVQAVEDDTREASPVEALRQTILFQPLHIPGFDRETTLAREIDCGQNAELNALNDGLFYWRGEDRLGVVPSRFTDRLRGQIDTQNVTRMLKQLPGHLGPDVQRVGGVTNRFIMFRASALMGTPV
jgi:hypothetical protein